MDKMKALVVICSVVLTLPVVLLCINQGIFWLALVALILGMIGILAGAGSSPQRDHDL